MKNYNPKLKNYPNLSQELKLWRQGYKFVVGLDEVGRGPLAGPVVAGAVSFLCHRNFLSVIPAKAGIQVNDFHFHGDGSGSRVKPGMTIWKKIRDSKKLTAKAREEWYKILTKHPDIKWGVGIVSEKIIDKINIFSATKLAMKKAINNLKKSYRMIHDRESYDRLTKNNKIDFLIIDGNFTLDGLAIAQKAIIRGDEKVFSCAAASIIAKVTRDHLMVRYAKKYPSYGFERHKGYGTVAHCAAIRKYRPCKIHRRSFNPIRN